MILNKQDIGVSTSATSWRGFWMVYALCVLLALLILGHMQLTTLSDGVGFSSNSAYYYHVLHPLRAALRSYMLVAAVLAIVICIGICAWHSVLSVLRAVLVISGACALYVLGTMLLYLIFIGFAVLRADAALVDALLVTAFLLPPILALCVSVQLFRAIGRGHTQSLWPTLVIAVLIGAQGVFLLSGGAMTALSGMLACAAAVILGGVAKVYSAKTAG